MNISMKFELSLTKDWLFLTKDVKKGKMVIFKSKMVKKGFRKVKNGILNYFLKFGEVWS